VGEITGEVFGTYGRRAGAVLLLSVLFIGVGGLVAAIALAVALGPLLAYMGELWQWMGTYDPYSGTFAPEPLPPPELVDPLRSGVTALASTLPFAGLLFLEGALAALLTAPGGRPMTAGGALRATLRRWVPLLPVVVVGLGFALLAVLGAAITPTSFVADPFDPSADALLLSTVLSLAWLVLLGLAIYLGTRWALAAAVIVIEDVGLRTALARSTAMTRGRMMHTFLALLVAGILASIIGLALVIVPLVLGGVGLFTGSTPLVAATVALFVLVQVLVGPLFPLAAAILYRDYRQADDAEAAASTH
jgi:hypothetical protein